MRRVVIVGAGFGGLRVARQLGGRELEVWLVDRHNYHLFHPLLYQVATASLEEEESVAYPIRAIIRKWRNERFVLAEVQGVDLTQRQVLTDVGPLPYDYLVLAAGSRTTFYGLEGAQPHTFDLKELEQATALRNHILLRFERATRATDPALRAALMTFVIVGAGPTGVEFVGALAELVYQALARDYPELPAAEARILLVERASAVLPAFPAPLQRYARKRLEHLGVEVALNASVSRVTPEALHLGDGRVVPACTVFWAAGIQATALADTLHVPQARGGRIVVQPDLSLEQHPEVFAIGDLAYLLQDGQPLPTVAPVAMQEGDYVGRAILAHVRGRQLPPFRYRDRGSMAILGRYAAVASVSGINLRGLVAWVAWLALHLYYLIGFRNRLVALLNWGYAYLLRDPKVRLITGKTHT